MTTDRADILVDPSARSPGTTEAEENGARDALYAKAVFGALMEAADAKADPVCTSCGNFLREDELIAGTCDDCDWASAQEALADEKEDR